MRKLELPENTNIRHTRNMYVFDCYAGGIRFDDLVVLKWENITDKHLKLITQKTYTQLDLDIPDGRKKYLIRSVIPQPVKPIMYSHL